MTLHPVHTVRKAIIPVAGFGTRLYPATRALKKDFFPIPCADGMVRPVILILLEELVKSGVEEICLVLGSEEIHAYIRSIIAEKYGQAVAAETSILYGGSCKASNAPELFAKPDIDGGLIGGASLKAADFKRIIDAWKK